MKQRSLLRFVVEGIEGVTVLVAVLISWPVSKRWLRDWGARKAEREGDWPGDHFVRPPHTTCTRAVDISAPARVVWQWVVQFGLGRAGFYSYELLERIAGIRVTNVESVVPEFQSLRVGDEIKLHPKAPGVPVVALEEARYVCFGSEVDGSDADRPDPNRSWSIYLDPDGDETRLLLRSCIEPLRNKTLGKRLAVVMDQPIDFVMEQRMLRTIRRLAESNR